MAWFGYQELIIDSSLVSGSTNLTDFPLLLTEDNLDTDVFSRAQSTGADIRFTSGTTSAEDGVFAREIVKFGSESTEIWVKIPELLNSSDTSIYCWYGESAVSEPESGSTSGRCTVWSDYNYVAHDGGPTDSTTANTFAFCGNTYGGITVSGATGKFGHDSGATYFDAASANYIDIDSPLPDPYFSLVDTDYTMSIWVTLDALGPSWFQSIVGRMLVDRTRGWQAPLHGELEGDSFMGRFKVYHFGATPEELLTPDAVTSGGSWTNITWTYNSGGTDMNIYFDGVLVTGGSLGNMIEPGYTARPVVFGADPRDGTPYHWDGNMDEFRVIEQELSSGWVATEYNNQNSPSTFTSGAAITQVDPFTAITSWAELAHMSGALDYNYSLMNDLGSGDTGYSGIGDSWIPVGSGATNQFVGVFSGNGYTISDLTITTGKARNGLFGSLDGNIYDVHLRNFTLNVPNQGYQGGIVGYQDSNSEISGCSVVGAFTGGAWGSGYVGGIAGSSYGGDIVDCWTNVNIMGTNTVGGITGIRAHMKRCYVLGTVSGTANYIGGLCGRLTYGSVYDCWTNAAVSGTGDGIGAFVGALQLGGGTISGSGWVNTSENPDVAIGGDYSGDTLTYEETDATVFYDQTHGIYTAGTYVWGFSGTPWYEWSDRYPLFTEEPPITGIVTTIMYNPAIIGASF